MAKKLTKAVVAHFDKVSEERIFATYQDAGSVRKMMDAIGLASVSRQLFYEWLKAGGEERKARWQEAREQLADAAAETIHEIGQTVTNETVPADRVKLESAKWIAEQFNRKLYGKAAPQVNVAVSVGSQWLQALTETVEGVPIEEGEELAATLITPPIADS